MTNLRTVKDRWLAHFTSLPDARAIIAQGFTRGSPVDADLAVTWGRLYDGPGINFAYDADDELAIMTVSERQSQSDNSAVLLFRASGLAMTHPDGFDQVAFWGQRIKPSLYLLGAAHNDEADDGYDGDEEPHNRLWQVITPLHGATTGGDLFDLMTWVEQRAG